MGDAPAILLAVVLAVFVFLVAPFLALASWIRIRALERRVEDLSRRLTAPGAASIAAETHVTAAPLSTVVVVSPQPAAPSSAPVPAPAPVAAPPPAPAVPVAPAVRPPGVPATGGATPPVPPVAPL